MTGKVAMNVTVSNCNTITSTKGEVLMRCFDIEKAAGS